jgi:hypothetical protein
MIKPTTTEKNMATQKQVIARLDQIGREQGLKTDVEKAQFLGIKPQNLLQYRKGLAPLPAHVAEIIGFNRVKKPATYTYEAK